MSEKNYKDPKDFDIPKSYIPITPQQLWEYSEDPVLRPFIRFFAKQVQDVMSVYFKGLETPEEQQFLRQCRKDIKALRRALDKAIRSSAEANQHDKSASGFVLQMLRCTNSSSSEEESYPFSVEIRPLLFTSLLEEEEKEGKRYPYVEGRYTVFLHLDQKHHFQMTRFAEPPVPLWYKYVMQEVLSVFSLPGIQMLFEVHYGEWDFIAQRIVEAILKSLKK